MLTPWTRVSTVKLREEFVLRALEPDACMAELCREYRISRQNGYKWLNRFQKEGLAGLRDQSRRPASAALKISGELAVQVVELRQQYGWGPKKLRRLLERRLNAPAPSTRTIARILARTHLSKARRPRNPDSERPSGAPTPTVEGPNDLWTVDFKGWWRAHNGERCDPLTARDAFSRYVLRAALLKGCDTAEVRAEFERLFEENGLPKAILSDNGPPFGCTSAPWGLTRLSAWWVSLGIEVLHSRPGCPQDNGGHERVHVDMLGLQARSAPTRLQQQVLCDEWRTEFNHIRPHEALAMKTPGEVYVPSTRRLRPKVVSRQYPQGAALRQVSGNGAFWWNGRAQFLSRALKGHTIALVRLPTQTRATIWFHHLALGELDLEHGTRVERILAGTCHPSLPKSPGVTR